MKNTTTQPTLASYLLLAVGLGIFSWSSVSCSPAEDVGAQEVQHGDDDGHGHGEDDGHGHGDEHGEDDGHGHGDEHGDHEEGAIELTDKQLAAAGIEIVEVGPGEVLEHLTLSAVVTPNLDTVMHVNPRVPGIVSSIEKHLGERVEKGDLLCTIESVELGSAVADYLRAASLVTAGEETLAQSRSLYKVRIDTSTSMLDGVIDVNQSIYDIEKDLQDKGVSTVRPLIEADRALRNSILERDRALAELAAERDAELLKVEVDLREKRILLTASDNRLSALGIDATKLDQTSPLVRGTYGIRASQQGIVSKRHITPGEYVGTATELYTIQDLSSVWIVASAYENQLRSVRVGQQAFVELNAFPGQKLSGEVSMVEFEIDPETRSIGVRVQLDNNSFESWPEEYPIRPGMFGQVSIVTSRRHAAVVIPESALAHEDAGDAVFVETGHGTFEKRPVEIRGVSYGPVEVISGLSVGERVATSRTFMLKSIERQSELGGGHSH